MLTTVFHSYYLERLSVKTALAIFCILVVVGNCLRALIESGIGYLYIGQLLIGIGNAFHINVNLKLVYNWFAPNNIKSSLSVILLIIYIEKGLMTMAPYLFVNERRQTATEQKNGVIAYFVLIVVSAIVGFIITTLFYKENPPHGFGTMTDGITPSGIFKSLKEYFREIARLTQSDYFIHHLLMFSLTIVSLHNISDALNLSVVHFGFTQLDGSLSLFYFYVAGLIGAIFYDMMLLKFGRENYFLRVYILIG